MSWYQTPVEKVELNSATLFQPLDEVVAMRKASSPDSKVIWYSPAFSRMT
jgi:hypothetical protein